MSENCKENFCPISLWMCDEADKYCMGSPNNGSRVEGGCCGPRNEICCIDCFYCLTPLGFILDIITFSCNLYFFVKPQALEVEVAAI